MAKELEKATKEFKVLAKEASDLTERMGSLSTNRQHFEAMVYEASEQLTRRVGELKKEGKTGTTLKDFAGDGEVKAILAEVENIKKKLAEIETGFGEVNQKGIKAHDAMIALQKDLQKEIADRTKKKDRKILAVDSKSLPDLEKLEKEIGKTGSGLNESVLQMIKTEGFKANPAKIDKQMETAVGKSPEAQAQMDEKILAKRGLDLRLLGRNLKLAQAKRAESKTALGECLKLLKAGDRGRARDALDLATAARTELQRIAEQYELALKGINSHDMTTMKESKDGKAILSSVEIITKLDAEAGKELDQILSKVKF